VTERFLHVIAVLLRVLLVYNTVSEGVVPNILKTHSAFTFKQLSHEDEGNVFL